MEETRLSANQDSSAATDASPRRRHGAPSVRGVHGHLDRERRVERRHGDVRHRVWLAHHKSQRRSGRRIAGSSVRQPAALPLHFAGRRFGGRHRFAATVIVVEIAILAVRSLFAVLVSFGLATTALLLATTFLLGVGGALTSPAWGSTILLLVLGQELESATALNSVGFNLGRAVGPALGGMAIAALGIAVPFWIFAASNFGIVAALIWWREPEKAPRACRQSVSSALSARAFATRRTISICVRP